MRVAVFGAGGVGGYFGGRLVAAGEDVVFIARGAHLDALRTHGLRVDSVKGDFVVRPARATDDPAEVGAVDVVLVCVKAWQVPEAAGAIRPLVGPDTCVVPLQNGVEAPSELAAALGTDRVLAGLCGIFSLILGPGHIRHAGGEPFVRFGELDNRPSARAERLRAAFLRAGVTAEIPPDIHVALWTKLVFVGPVGGVGAVTRAPAGVWRAVPETRQMVEQAMREVQAIARGRGVAVRPDALSWAMTTLDELPPETTASMQRDLIEGRPSELEAQIGAVVRLGREAGAATPLHAFLYGSLLPQERRARGRIGAAA